MSEVDALVIADKTISESQFSNVDAVILYENDSKDKTRSILEKHKKENYHYIFEDNVKEPLRTKRLANGRNKILEKMHEINKDKYYEHI
jgi:hypothetical protein